MFLHPFVQHRGLTRLRAIAIGLTLSFATAAVPAVGDAQADLLPRQHPMSPFGLSPASVGAGGSLTIRAWWLVNGGTAAGPFVVRVLLSDDATASPGDRILWAASIPSLDASTTRLMPAVTVTIPTGTPVSSYRVGVVVDAGDAVAESNETNNQLWASGTLTVVGPTNADLTLATGANGPIGVGNLNSPHFYPTGSPVAVAPSADLILRYSVQNSGPEPTTATTARYYLSTDANVTTADRLLSSVTVNPLASGASQNVGAVYLRLPDDVVPGDYHLGILVDPQNAVLEVAGGGETNNVLVRALRVLAIAPDSTSVFRARLRIKTGTGNNADTDGTVRARLGTGNQTRLDYARDDFNKGDNNWYDLVLDGIARYGDVRTVDLNVPGSDALCVDAVVLEINLIAVASSDPAGCVWVENGTKTFLNYAQMRDAATWRAPTIADLLAVGLDLGDVASLVQAAVGNELGDRFCRDVWPGSVCGEPKWGHYKGANHLTVTRESDQRISVDLDMYVDVDNLPDPDLDVDFDIVLDCADGKFIVKVEQMKIAVDSKWYTLFYDWFVDGVIEDAIRRELRRSMERMADMVPDDALGGTGLCLTVKANGSISPW